MKYNNDDNELSKFLLLTFFITAMLYFGTHIFVGKVKGVSGEIRRYK